MTYNWLNSNPISDRTYAWGVQAMTESSRTNHSSSASAPAAAKADRCLVHSSLEGLVWRGDGAQQNFFAEPLDVRLDDGGVHACLTFGPAEASAIFEHRSPGTGVSHPGKSGVRFTPEILQSIVVADLSDADRSAYYSLLLDPYNSSRYINYVYVLYGGLERTLMSGQFEKAYAVIQQLMLCYYDRDFHEAVSNLLLFAALYYHRADFISRYRDALDSTHIYRFSPDLYLAAARSVDLTIGAEDLIRLYRIAGIARLNYIKFYRPKFKHNLENLLSERFGQAEIPLSEYCGDVDPESLPRTELRIFYNSSADPGTITLPRYSLWPDFVKQLKADLEEADFRSDQEFRLVYGYEV
jgi:hypothetical protein